MHGGKGRTTFSLLSDDSHNLSHRIIFFSMIKTQDENKKISKCILIRLNDIYPCHLDQFWFSPM